MVLTKETVWRGLQSLGQDFKAITKLQEWKPIPGRTKELVVSIATRKPMSEPLTRREFLQLSGVASAGALLAACAPAVFNELTKPPNTEPKIGLITDSGGNQLLTDQLNIVKKQSGIVDCKPMIIGADSGKPGLAETVGLCDLGTSTQIVMRKATNGRTEVLNKPLTTKPGNQEEVGYAGADGKWVTVMKIGGSDPTWVFSNGQEMPIKFDATQSPEWGKMMGNILAPVINVIGVEPTAVPTSTKTSTPTATQEATATAQPTPEGPIVDKMIFDRGSVDPSTVKLIINPVNNDDIGRYYDQGSVTTVFVLPEKIFLAKDSKYYCKCYLDTGDPVIFQVGEVRTYVAGERIKLVEESQYGKLSVDFGNRTAGVNIRAQRPSGGWTIRRIKSYLLDATKEVTSLSVQITLTK